MSGWLVVMAWAYLRYFPLSLSLFLSLYGVVFTYLKRKLKIHDDIVVVIDDHTILPYAQTVLWTKSVVCMDDTWASLVILNVK